eukprot:Sdes_comp22569_c0_seq1m20999
MNSFESLKENTFGKLSFVTHLPLLLKATSDDPEPTSGYALQEILKLTQQSSSLCSEVHFFLLGKLQKDSSWVKLKVLKIMRYLCLKGPFIYRRELSKNATLISSSIDVKAKPDPIHGDRITTQLKQLVEELVNETLSTPSSIPTLHSSEEDPSHSSS